MRKEPEDSRLEGLRWWEVTGREVVGDWGGEGQVTRWESAPVLLDAGIGLG